MDESAKKQKSKPKTEGNDPNACKKCGEVHEKCTGHKRRKSKEDPWQKCNSNPAKGSRTRKCKNHGGSTPKGVASPHFKDGSQSKYVFLPDETAKRVEHLAFDSIRNLEHNVRLQMTFATELYEKLGTGESLEAWRQIRSLLDGIDFLDLISDIPKVFSTILQLKLIAAGAIAQDGVKAKIVASHETQRKLTETLTKCRKDLQETFTMAQWDELLILVLSIIRNNVDRATLTRIQNAFVLAGGGGTGDQSGPPKLIEAG